MKWMLLILGVFVAMPVAFFVALNLLASDEQTDCTKVREPKPGVWQAGDFATRSDIATELSLCERLQGRTRGQVEALLGPPTEALTGSLRYDLSKDSTGPRDNWILYVDADGRVRDTRYVSTGFPG